MQTFIEEQIALGILPTSKGVIYHQRIESEINYRNRIEKQILNKEIEVSIVAYNPMFFTVKIGTKNMNLQLDSILKKQENLTKEVYGILENIEFRMNWRGELIEIVNHKEIVENWKNKKPKLKERYKGQAVERYLIGLEKKIQQHDKLLADCLQYRLYGLLFNDLFGHHSNDSKEVQCRERILGNAVYQLPLSIREKVLLEEEGAEKVMLGISGTLDKEQPYATKIRNLFQRKSSIDPNGMRLETYKGAYRYDKKTGIFDAAALNIVTTYGEDYKKTQNYTLEQEV